MDPAPGKKSFLLAKKAAGSWQQDDISVERLKKSGKTVKKLQYFQPWGLGLKFGKTESPIWVPPTSARNLEVTRERINTQPVFFVPYRLM